MIPIGISRSERVNKTVITRVLRVVNGFIYARNVVCHSVSRRDKF